MKNLKPILSELKYTLKVIRIAFVCFFGIGMFFIFSSNLSDVLGSVLRVNSAYTGGEIADDFIDDSAELMRYTVYKPVTNAHWQASADYWQLNLEYRNASEEKRKASIYIDIDSIDGGSTKALFNPEAKINFSDHPWNYALYITDGTSKLYDSEGNFICNTEYYELNEKREIKNRIPLKDENLMRVLGSKETWHYIISDDADYSGESINALEVSMTSQKNSKVSKKEADEFVNRIKKEFAESIGKTKNTDSIEKRLAYYKEKLDENPDDYVSMACYGSALAEKGGESSVFKAVALVNEAYTYLDKAAELSFNKEGELDVLLNRASVSAAVPQGVFGKAECGAKDFMRSASLTEDKKLKAYCYAMAYECYMKCSKKTDAFIALQEAKKMVQ